jgi:ABC-2 type transport system permease protein
LRAYRALLAANYREFVRDRAALFWTFAFPLLFILVFGLIFSGDEVPSYDVGLVDEDGSPQAGVLTEILERVEAFDLTAGDRTEELARLQGGERRAVLIIPAGFGASIGGAAPRPLEVHYDASQQATQQIVVPVLQRAMEQADRALTNTPPMVRAEFHPLQSERLSSLDFIIPGIVAMSVMQAGVFSAVNIVSLRERRVLRRLQTTPLRPFVLVTSTVAFRLVIVLLQSAVLIVVARLVFGVKLLGNLPGLAGVVLLGGLAFVAIGFFIAALVRTEESFMPIAQSVTFPMMFLSGIFFPIEVMPDWIRPVANALPLTFLGDAVRQLMVGGIPVNALAVDLAAMAAFLTVFMALAIRFFRFE